MSTTIDERVVEMRFDNGQFESGVKQSMSTLEKLKQSLNFDSAVQGISKLGDGMKSISVDNLSGAVETVREKFSAMEVVAITALANITNSAINTGKELISSLSVDQIAAGWEKFGNKTTSVSTLVSQGYALEQVNDQLDRLNWFTDETSYNFTDMVSNISKFTATGQDLEASVTAMEGIANWAALSGQNATTASRAMYQLSQAMGKGVLKYDDWKSIQNASMDTVEFRQNAIDAAIALGKVKKIGEDTYSVIGGKKGLTFSLAEMFTSDALSRQQWFDADVMMSTFQKYSSAVDQIYEYSEKNGITASQAIEDLGDQVDVFGLKAFRAAQEARTWADVLDSVKDAVSTGWMQTFENIFGNYDEAKTLWTDLANELYDVFAEGGNARNLMLRAWKDLGGRDTLFANTDEMTGAFWNVFYALRDVGNAISSAFRSIFPETTAEQLLLFTTRLQNFTAKLRLSDKSSRKLKSTFEGLFAVLKYAKEVIVAVLKGFKPLVDVFKDGSGKLLDLTSNAGEFLKKITGFGTPIEKVTSLVKKIPHNFKDTLSDFNVISDKLIDPIHNCKDALEELGDYHPETIFQKITKSVSKATQSLVDFVLDFPSNALVSYTEGGEGLNGVLEALFDTLGNIVRVVLDIASALTGINLENAKEKIVTFIQTVRDTVTRGVDAIQTAFQKITGKTIGEAFTDIKDKLSDFWDKIKEVFAGFKDHKNFDTSGLDDFLDRFKKRFEPLTVLFDGFGKLLSGIWGLFKKLLPLFGNLAKGIGSGLGEIGTVITDAIADADFNSLADLANSGILISIGVQISKFLKNINKAKDSSKSGGLKDIIDSITTTINTFKSSIEEFTKSIKISQLLSIAGAIAILTASMVALSLIDSNKLGQVLGVMTVEFGELMLAFKSLNSSLGKNDNSGSVFKAATAMIAMGAALLLLASVTKKLGKMNAGELERGLLAVSALAGLMVVLAKTMSSMTSLSDSASSIAKASAGLMIFALAMQMFVKPIKTLGEMDAAQLEQGMLSFGLISAGILAGISALSNALNKNGGAGNLTKAATAMLIMSGAVVILSGAIKKLGEMDASNMLQGIAGLSAVLLALGSFTQLVSNTKGVVTAAIGLTIIAGAVMIFSSAVEKLGGMNPSELGQGLIGLGSILAGIAVFANAFPKDLAARLPLVGAGLVLMGAALTIMVSAVKKLGEMDVSELQNGIMGLAAALVIVSAAANAMKGTIGSAASLLIMAGAIAILAPAIKSLGSMSIDEIGTALFTLATAFGVMGAAAFILGPVVPVILALAGAFTLFGVAALACGAGILALSVGLGGLATLGAAGVAALVLAIEAVTALIPSIAITIANGIITFAETIAEGAARLVAAAVTVVKALLEGLRETIPDIVVTIFELLEAVLTALVDYTPRLLSLALQLGIAIFKTLISGLVSMVGPILKTIGDTILKIFQKIKEKFPEFLEKGKELMTKLKDGIHAKIQEVANKASELVAKVKEKIKEKTQEFKDIGKNLIDGLKKGIEDAARDVVEAAKSVVDGAVSGAKRLLGIHSPSKVFAEIGQFMDLGLIQGLNKLSGDVEDATADIGSSAVDSMNNSIATLFGVWQNLDNLQPTIKPVLDLSNLTKGLNDIGELFELTRSIELADLAKADMDATFNNQNGINVDNDDVVEAINSLREDLAMLASIVSNLTVVMDSGALVGSISSKMNDSLGRQQILEGRGVQ